MIGQEKLKQGQKKKFLEFTGINWESLKFFIHPLTLVYDLRLKIYDLFVINDLRSTFDQRFWWSTIYVGHKQDKKFAVKRRFLVQMNCVRSNFRGGQT